jgi:PTH2 family peptidyl-tRNA hydrolase
MKQVIIVRQDLKMPKGKMAAQVAHASVEAVLVSDEQIVEEWRGEGMKKVVLKVPSRKELFIYYKKAKKERLNLSIIKDAGRTFLKPGTVTCVAIGPNEEGEINPIINDLKLL